VKPKTTRPHRRACPASRRAIRVALPDFLAAVEEYLAGCGASARQIAVFREDLTPTLRRRMVAGMATYGDASFRRCARTLISEIDLEHVDVLGWFAVLWAKGQGLEQLRRFLDVPASAFLNWCRVRELERLGGEMERDVRVRRRRSRCRPGYR